MLSSISPVGESARHQRWWITVVTYIVGSAGAGAAFGASLGALGSLTPVGPRAALALFAILTLVGLVADRTTGVPSLHRQVDQRWLTTYRGWVYGLGFGAQLGVGVVTVVGSSIVWLTWAAAALSRSPVAGALIGLAFGSARALPLLAARRLDTATALRTAMAGMEDRRHLATQVTIGGQLLIAVLAASALIW